MEKGVVGQNRVDFFDLPHLLLLFLVVFLVSNGDEVRYTHAYCEESFVRVAVCDKFVLFSLIVNQVSLQIEYKILLPHLSLSNELQLDSKLLEGLDRLALGRCSQRERSFGNVLEVLPCPGFVDIIKIQKIEFIYDQLDFILFFLL